MHGACLQARRSGCTSPQLVAFGNIATIASDRQPCNMSLSIGVGHARQAYPCALVYVAASDRDIAVNALAKAEDLRGGVGDQSII